MTAYFSKTVDHTNKGEMIDFLRNHETYYTMNSWNLAQAPAHNVKYYNLGLDQETLDKAYSLHTLDGTPFELEMLIVDRIREFSYEYKFNTIGFNGRSGGYLVLYERAYDKNNTLRTYPGRAVFQCIDFDISLNELRDIVKVVQAFDKACDDIRDLFIGYLKTHEMVQEQIVLEKTINIMKAID